VRFLCRTLPFFSPIRCSVFFPGLSRSVRGYHGPLLGGLLAGPSRVMTPPHAVPFLLVLDAFFTLPLSRWFCGDAAADDLGPLDLAVLAYLRTLSTYFFPRSLAPIFASGLSGAFPADHPYTLRFLRTLPALHASLEQVTDVRSSLEVMEISPGH